MKINVTPTFKSTVTVKTQEGIDTCTATFKAIPFSQLEEFDLDTPEGTRKALGELLIELDGLEDANGKSVPFCDEVLDWILDQPIHRAAVFEAYTKGIQEAATGN